MTTLKSGSIAPEFSLKDKDGTPHSLMQVKSKYTVVFFYPKDDTPGCTIEAKEISAALTKFTKSGVTVFGISGGDEKSKKKFCEKFGLKVTLLSDTDLSVSSAYGCYGEKSFMGRTFMGIMRTTFLLDEKKHIVKVFDGVKPEGHAAELLAAVETLKKGGSLYESDAEKPPVKSGEKKRAVPVKKTGGTKKSASKKASSKQSKKSPIKAATKASPKGRSAESKKSAKKVVKKVSKKGASIKKKK